MARGDPSSVDVAVGATVTVAVVLDASAVTRAGRYEGRLRLASSSPYPIPELAVDLVVTPPAG